MTSNKKICVFCSANDSIDAKYFHAASELGTYLATHEHTLVYGGCALGLMECVAKAAHDAGGKIIGIVPSKVEENSKTSQYQDTAILCQNLNDRKQIMMDNADLFIALPGGLGTLDEIFTVAASETIGYHHKKVILYNIDGFWNSLIALLEDLQNTKMMRKHYSAQILTANSFEELVSIISTI